MKRSLIFIISAISVLVIISCAEKQGGTKLSGDYLGQKPPGIKPEIFAPGIVSTGLFESNLIISPDGNEIYYTSILGQFDKAHIVVIRRENNVWSEPAIMKHLTDKKYKYVEPAISADGNRFFFVSNMADDMKGPAKPDFDIWIMDRENGEWGKPWNPGEPVNSENGEYFPSVTKEGTLYFTQEFHNPMRNHIARSRLIDGKYSAPEKLPEEVNSTQTQFNAFVDPEETFIIVPTAGRKDSYGSTDYYISFRDKDDKWSGPFNMGEYLNTAGGREYSGYLSPDRKYLFFMTTRPYTKYEQKEQMTYPDMLKSVSEPGNGNPDIYWMSASIIDTLRAQYLEN